MSCSGAGGGGDGCGWAAAFVSCLAFGSFGVPIKGDAANSVDIDPLVMQSYKTGVCFLTSWLVLLLGQEFSYTPWGIVSGLFWVPGGVAAIYGIRNAGLAITLGLTSSLIVLVSFTWGIFVFREGVRSIGGACLAVVLLIVGLWGMAYYSTPTPAEAGETSGGGSFDDSGDDDEMLSVPPHCADGVSIEGLSLSSTADADGAAGSVEGRGESRGGRGRGRGGGYSALGQREGGGGGDGRGGIIGGDGERRRGGSSPISSSPNEILLTPLAPEGGGNGGAGAHLHCRHRAEASPAGRGLAARDGGPCADGEEGAAATTTSFVPRRSPTTGMGGRSIPLSMEGAVGGREGGASAGSGAGGGSPEHRSLCSESTTTGRRQATYSVIDPIGAGGEDAGDCCHAVRLADENDAISTPTTGDDQPDSPYVVFCGRKVTRRKLGLACGVFNGLWGGSIMVPMHFASGNTGGLGYVISFAIGASIVTLALWIARYLYNLQRTYSAVSAWRALPSFHIRVMWLPGGLAGALWSIGNIGSIISVEHLGEGVGYSVVQSAMLVSGLWGILWFREIRGARKILRWFSAASITVVGILLLSHEHLKTP